MFREKMKKLKVYDNDEDNNDGQQTNLDQKHS